MAVNFNYNQIVAQAKLLDELAGDMQNNCSKKMGEISDNIGAAWSGQAALVYMKHVNGVQIDILNKARYIRDTAEFLRSAANKMKAADEAAKAAAANI